MSKRRDKPKVKSLWHTYAPAEWWSESIKLNASDVTSMYKAYSIRDLRIMASKLGIDARMTKMSLAKCIVAEKNWFFPHEVGNYDHNTLVYFVKHFKLLPELSDDGIFKKRKVDLQKVLLDAWNGGTEEGMNINLQHVIELHEITQAMEEKFCSSRVKKMFRERDERGSVSFHEYVENSLVAVLELYHQWMHTQDTDSKRRLFVATQMAYTHAETAVTEYLRMIKKHCHIEVTDDCNAANIPPAVSQWARSTLWEDCIILCNVTVQGRNVEFREGDELLSGYTIGISVRVKAKNRENVVWLGIGIPNSLDPDYHTKPEQPQPQKIPNRAFPFDSVRLGQLMDLYTGQRTSQNIPTRISRAEPIQAQEPTPPVKIPTNEPTKQLVKKPTKEPVNDRTMEPIKGPTLGSKVKDSLWKITKDAWGAITPVVSETLLNVLMLGAISGVQDGSVPEFRWKGEGNEDIKDPEIIVDVVQGPRIRKFFQFSTPPEPTKPIGLGAPALPTASGPERESIQRPSQFLPTASGPEREAIQRPSPFLPTASGPEREAIQRPSHPVTFPTTVYTNTSISAKDQSDLAKAAQETLITFGTRLSDNIANPLNMLSVLDLGGGGFPVMLPDLNKVVEGVPSEAYSLRRVISRFLENARVLYSGPELTSKYVRISVSNLRRFYKRFEENDTGVWNKFRFSQSVRRQVQNFFKSMRALNILWKNTPVSKNEELQTVETLIPDSGIVFTNATMIDPSGVVDGVKVLMGLMGTDLDPTLDDALIDNGDRGKGFTLQDGFVVVENLNELRILQVNYRQQYALRRIQYFCSV
jgi:hypothetical protein